MLSFPLKRPPSLPCFSSDLESDLKVRTSPPGKASQGFPPGALTRWHRHHRCWGIFTSWAAFRCESQLPACQIHVGPVFTVGELAVVKSFTCRPGQARPFLRCLAPPFNIGSELSDSQWLLCPPPPPRLLAEGRDDSRLQWQDRLCSVLSHRRKPVGFAGFENH